MIDVLAVVQFVAALLLLAPLVLIVVCSLRRANRKIDQILREECGQDTHVPEARAPARAEQRDVPTLSGDRDRERERAEGAAG